MPAWGYTTGFRVSAGQWGRLGRSEQNLTRCRSTNYRSNAAHVQPPALSSIGRVQIFLIEQNLR